jgi:hypothetical protein
MKVKFYFDVPHWPIEPDWFKQLTASTTVYGPASNNWKRISFVVDMPEIESVDIGEATELKVCDE